MISLLVLYVEIALHCYPSGLVREGNGNGNANEGAAFFYFFGWIDRVDECLSNFLEILKLVWWLLPCSRVFFLLYCLVIFGFR